eukprot:g18210.t1
MRDDNPSNDFWRFLIFQLTTQRVHTARGANRGESRRRVPPEEKGLLKTQCFFEEKDLVIKLYDTEVLVIKERVAVMATARTSGRRPVSRVGARTKQFQILRPAPDFTGGRARHPRGVAARRRGVVVVSPPKEKTTKDDDDGSETQSLVLELTSGGFRTAETKAILNEALKPMALQVESENGATWQLRSEYKTPGQVTTDSSLQPQGSHATLGRSLAPRCARSPSMAAAAGALAAASTAWMAASRRLLRWQGSFVWATAHFCPSLFLRNVPHSETCFSFGSLYIFSQALGLVWMFLVVLLAVMSVRIVTLSMNKAVQHLSTAVEAPAGTLPVYGDQPLRAVALCYVYYSVIRLIILFARSMWTVAWELYHDFPTLRRMLLLEGRASPRNDKDKGGAAARPSPRGSPQSRKCSKDGEDAQSTHIRRQTRRRIVLVTPLLVLALGHLTLLLGQSYCDGRSGGICGDALPIFQPTAHLNRTIRFVLFVSQIQWFQAFTGLFIHWSTAIAQGKGLLPRLVSFTLLGLLMPCSSCRLFAWLVQPAGSGVVRRTLGGVPHHVADTALVTAWSWWSLAAVSVVMRPQLFGLSGFTLRSVSLDSRWRLLTTLFKYTLFFWMAVHFLRGCVAHGFAAAQTDLITISFMYPMFLCFVWTATFIAVSLSGLFCGLVPLLGALVAVPGILLLSRLLCGWVDRDQHVLLTTLTWLHLLRAGFRVSRYMGLWWKTSVPSRFEAPPIEIKFAVNPDSHKVLKTTYTVERRFGRIAARVLLLICGTFLLILCLGRKRGKRGEDGRQCHDGTN